MVPYLIAGVIGYAFNARKKKYSLYNKVPKDILFNCSSIKIIDKTKFYNNLELKIIENFKSHNLELSDFSKINLSDFILDFFQKNHPLCYKKFISKKLNSTEKISIMLYFEEFFEVFRKLILKNYLDYDLFDIKLKIFVEQCKTYMNNQTEMQDFPRIYENFKITYKYPY